MKRNIFCGVLGVLLVCGFILVGSSVPASAAEPAPETIKIGGMISLTGPDAAIGAPAKLGYEVALEEINKGGGVMVKAYNKKIPLELVLMDMETNAEKSIARAETLHSRKVSAAVGTTIVGASAEIFEKNKLPVLAILNSISAITDRGLKYFFVVGGSSRHIGQTVFDALATPTAIKSTKWAIFREQGEFVSEFFDSAREIAAKKGITITYEGSYAMRTPDLSALITGAKNSGAEVLLSYPTPPDAVTMLKQMAQLGFKPKAILMLRAADDPSWARLGILGDYVIACPDWHSAFNHPGVKELNDMVKAKTGKTTDPTTGAAYNSVKIVAAAIEKAGSLDRTAIRDAIAGTDMMTVEGHVKFGPNKTRVNVVRPVVQWQNGVMEVVWPDNQKTKPLVYPIPSK